jgi:hypothetical protein
MLVEQIVSAATTALVVSLREMNLSMFRKFHVFKSKTELARSKPRIKALKNNN